MRICPPVRICVLLSIASSFRSVITDFASIERPTSWVCLTLTINRIRPLLEGCGKALERGVEHRAHQHRQQPALELVGEVKSDIAVGFGSGLEGPAVFQIA